MDNVTHTLIGIAAAETLATTRFRKARVPLWIASGVANNLPDLDVLYTWGRRGDRLLYMLHHRGYTHTVLLAPVQGLLWLAVLRLWWRKRDDIPWGAVSALCVLGPLLHLLADSWNSYGVHPFWPVDNRWYYGDFLFIVEPWIWAILLPLIWKRASTKYGKATALALLVFLAGLCWYHPYVTWPVALAITLFSGAWVGAQRLLLDDRKRLACALAALAIVFGAFAAANWRVKESFAGEGREIAALTQPGNPFCWTVLAAGFIGRTYRAAAWTASPWPSLVPASACPPARVGTRAELQPLPGAAAPDRVPIGQFLGTRADYDELTKSCRVRAYLRFARIPFWRVEGKTRLVGDLRFDRSFNFAESDGAGEACPSFEPPWLGRFFPSEL